MDNKIIYGTITILGILGILAVGGVHTGLLVSGEKGQGGSQPVQYHSHVVVRKNGEVIWTGKNDFMYEGSDFIAQAINDPSSGDVGGGVDQMGVGNLGSTSKDHGSWTGNDLTTQGTSNPKGSLSWSEIGQGGTNGLQNLTASVEWTSDEDGKNVNATYLNASTAASDDNYFAEATFKDVTLQTDDRITVTWYIWAE